MRNKVSERLHSFASLLIVILASVSVGACISLRLQAQSSIPPEFAVTQFQVTIISEQIKDLEIRLNKIQQEADTTEAMGAGIGVAITFLQLLGFLKRKEKV